MGAERNDEERARNSRVGANGRHEEAKGVGSMKTLASEASFPEYVTQSVFCAIVPVPSGLRAAQKPCSASTTTSGSVMYMLWTASGLSIRRKNGAPGIPVRYW